MLKTTVLSLSRKAENVEVYKLYVKRESVDVYVQSGRERENFRDYVQ